METLTLAAHFSMGSLLSPEEKKAFVKSVVNDLGTCLPPFDASLVACFHS